MKATMLTSPSRQPHWTALAVLIVATGLTAAVGAYASFDAKDC